MTLSSICYWCADQVVVEHLFTTNTIMTKIITKFIFTTTKKIISGDRATHPLRQDDHPRQGRLCTGRLPQGLIFYSTNFFEYYDNIHFKFLPLFLLVLPGMAARVLYRCSMFYTYSTISLSTGTR